MSIKKLISFMFLFAIMFYSAIANAGPNLVADEYGCYYWNGDRNYLAITTSGFSHVMAKLDTARFEKYNGINTVNVMLCLITPDGENIIVRTHGIFLGTEVLSIWQEAIVI